MSHSSRAATRRSFGPAERRVVLVSAAVAVLAVPSIAMARKQENPPGAPPNTAANAGGKFDSVIRPDPRGLPNQQLLARSATGGSPNESASQPVLSYDSRLSRYAAYTSTATNVAGQADGRHSNVYLVERGGKIGKNGTPWNVSGTSLASAGSGGAADGDSFGPALDGYTGRKDKAYGPKTLAFVSRATNLVAGDTNGRADVFVRRLYGSSSLKRIASPSGDATAVGVSGDGKVLVIATDTGLYAKRGSHRAKPIAKGGGIGTPRTTRSGLEATYARHGSVYVVNTKTGKRHRIARGSDPSADGGDYKHRGGRIGAVAYESGSHVYYRSLRPRKRAHRIARGDAPSMTAGAVGAAFAYGPFVYIYSTANGGYKHPQGYCPVDQGAVRDVFSGPRFNYVAFSCEGGAVYLSYVGPK